MILKKARMAAPDCCTEMRDALGAEPGFWWTADESRSLSLACNKNPKLYIQGCDGCSHDEPVRFCPFCGEAIREHSRGA